MKRVLFVASMVATLLLHSATALASNESSESAVSAGVNDEVPVVTSTPKFSGFIINNFLYKGDGRYSWATSVLPIINVDKDVETLNTYIMDALRACATGKKKIGGLGSVNDQPDHTILRGTGKNVTANRSKTDKEIEGFLTIGCMRNALLTRRAVFETLVRTM